MPVSPDVFRTALSRFASGVTVVTTSDSSGKYYGITVSAFCSVSLEPPLVLVCIEKAAGSHHAFEESGSFTVNILSAAHAALSEHFASLVEDKFRGIDIERGPSGTPYLADSIVTLDCSLHRALDGGDHTIFLGRVDDVIVRSGDPLIYYHGKYHVISE